MEHDAKNQRPALSGKLPGVPIKQVQNIFIGLLEGNAGVKVNVRKCRMKFCKKRGIFEAA